MDIDQNQLAFFIHGSNEIEDVPEVTEAEVAEYNRFLRLETITIAEILDFARVLKTHRPPDLRIARGMDVVVGDHFPMPGGPQVKTALQALLDVMNHPDVGSSAKNVYEQHVMYETIHPLMDGNGRTGRAITLWQELRAGRGRMLKLGFAREWYYRSLSTFRNMRSQEELVKRFLT